MLPCGCDARCHRDHQPGGLLVEVDPTAKMVSTKLLLPFVCQGAMADNLKMTILQDAADTRPSASGSEVRVGCTYSHDLGYRAPSSVSART